MYSQLDKDMDKIDKYFKQINKNDINVTGYLFLQEEQALSNISILTMHQGDLRILRN